MTEANSSGDLNQLMADVAAMREKMAAQEAELNALRTQVGSLSDAPAESGSKSLAPAKSSRRQMLKMGGAAAAGLALLAGANGLGKQEIVSAADLDVVQVAQTVSPTTNASNPTIIQSPAKESALASDLFGVFNYTGATAPSIPTGIATAIAGITAGAASGITSVGVYGLAAGGIGTTSGTYKPSFGVVGGSTGSDTAPGIGGYFYGTTADLAIKPNGAAPTATAVYHNAGEFYVDATGALWYSIAAGTPGTWVSLAAPSPAGAQAVGSLQLLGAPVRVVDTRPNSGLQAANTPLRYRQNVAYQIAGQVPSVPTAAKGVIGNITIIQPSGATAPILPAGFLVLGADVPVVTASSALNWDAGTLATGNNFSSALSSAGKLNVLASFYNNDTTATAELTIDITGYYL